METCRSKSFLSQEKVGRQIFPLWGQTPPFSLGCWASFPPGQTPSPFPGLGRREGQAVTRLAEVPREPSKGPPPTPGQTPLPATPWVCTQNTGGSRACSLHGSWSKQIGQADVSAAAGVRGLPVSLGQHELPSRNCPHGAEPPSTASLFRRTHPFYTTQPTALRLDEAGALGPDSWVPTSRQAARALTPCMPTLPTHVPLAQLSFPFALPVLHLQPPHLSRARKAGRGREGNG